MGLREHKDGEAAFLKSAAIFPPNRDEARVFYFSFYTNEQFLGPADMQNKTDVLNSPVFRGLASNLSSTG